MRNIFIIIITFIIHLNTYSQEYKILYGDNKCMVQDTNEKLFWLLKDSLPDGEWIVFYDKKNTQKAIQVCYKNGVKEGKYLEWDRNGLFSFDIDYKNGLRDGLWISYFYAEGERYINISLWKDNIEIKTIQIEH